ncbi:FUSC family protein [Kineosporia sp. NBRC 101731]|uniref:FUSC family protein n=1 Tax=Kineosporia sp. NBRC 101731 TaxID=3032199 RepID=UPI0024A12312|nr:FUSC family protein [Kineosporia sp. NBRC 101731]GLY30146.1 FUSC family protein [Kineosporia sp. NBRC 101731]
MPTELSTPRALVRSWGLTELRPHEHAHWAALRAVLSVGAPIAVVLALGRSDLTLFASFGAFNSLYGRHSMYSSRLRMQTETGAFMVGVVTLGVVVAAIGGTWLAITATAAVSVTTYLVSRWAQWAPPGALFAVFAVGACSSHPQEWGMVPIALAVSACAALWSVLVGQSGWLFPAGRHREKRPGKVRLGRAELFGAQGVRGDLLAYAAGPAIAGTVAAAIGGAHPYWAMVSAVAPLTGPSSTHRVARALHRVWGTAAGVLLSLAILVFDPNVVTTLVIALLAQAWAELFVMRNYGLAVVGITPLALLMQHLAVTSDPLATSTDRLVETALGAAIGVALIVATSRPRPPA